MFEIFCRIIYNESISLILRDMRMKKIRLAAAIALLPLVLLCGCSYNTLNDAENGEIVIGELKRPFADGVYYAYGAYLNDDGYRGVMKISVNNSMITAIHFDYVDGRMRRYTQYAPADDVQSFKTTTKNLTSIVIADQDYMAIRRLADDKTSKDFLALMVLIFPNLQTGDTAARVLIQPESYTALGDALYFSYRPVLTVEYLGENVSMINFSLTDANGVAFDATKAPDNMLPRESAYTYAKIIQFINAVPDDGTTLYKKAPDSQWYFLLSMYNDLASDVENKHTTADIDLNAIF